MGPKGAREIEQLVRDEGIDHVFVEFPDINGLSRSKQLDAEYFLERYEGGFSMNLSLITQTPRSAVVEDSRYGDHIDYADGIARPDPRTFRPVPWRENVARVICDIEYEDSPVAGAPRTVLQRVLERAGEFGLEFGVGNELEFFLLIPTEDGYEPATSDKHENLTQATEAVAPFYDRVYDWARSFGIDVNTFHHEFGAGQLEILFDHGDPLDQADQTFRFKELVKQAAVDWDCHATFMAKPFTGRSGSGFHLHVSAFADGENAFGTDAGLTDDGRRFVGGLLEHAPALTALGTPNLNGFKRHQPDTFAPTTASWGHGNRYAAVRVPAYGTPRIENRIASADANPYLVTAATIAAGCHGIDDGLEPPDPSVGDPIEERPRLPRSPGEALDALEEDAVLRDWLGEEAIGEYLVMKRQERETFYTETTAWERDQYIETL